jgi:TolB-like protein
MGPSNGGTTLSGDKNRSSLVGLFQKLRKRHIIETLAAFIGGGWLLVEVVERLLVSHYHLPDRLIDLTVVSVIGALFATLVWRWFRSAEKRPGNVKVEILFVPLIVLATGAIDLIVFLRMRDLGGKTVLISAVAAVLGVAWVILKLSQWASAAPLSPLDPSRATAATPSPLPVPPDKSIVVLPFANISPEEGQEYFCDGMTEEIISDLSHVRDLLVISRSSAMTFKGTRKTIPEIARTVNVRYVMEGSVRKSGNDLRITAQLIDAMTDAHVWSEKYSGRLDDVFAIQENVSRSIANALSLRLTPEEKSVLAARPIPNVYAYECYIKARQELWTWTEGGLSNSLAHLQKGLDIIGENAVLLAGMGYTYFQHINTGFRTDELTWQKAKEYTERALEIDPESPIAHVVLGLLLPEQGKVKEGIRHLKKALVGEPNNFDALVWLASFLFILGKPDAAWFYADRLMKTEPLSPMTPYIRGLVYMNGDFEGSENVYRQAHRDFPQHPLIRWNLGLTLAYLGRVEEAYSFIKPLLDETPKDLLSRMIYGLLLSKQGRQAEALLILRDPKMEDWARKDLCYSFWVGESYGLLGLRSEALDWLENAVDRGFINYPFMAEKDPLLTNIRREERFKKLMERVKYEWEHIEV